MRVEVVRVFYQHLDAKRLAEQAQARHDQDLKHLQRMQELDAQRLNRVQGRVDVYV